MHQHIQNYVHALVASLSLPAMESVGYLASALGKAWQSGAAVFLCGNGGSAANAIHIANDLLYGVGVDAKCRGLRVEALAANSAVLTCLANDLGYDQIFSEQLSVKARPGDILIVLSGSGNSPNVVRAIEVGNEIGMRTFAILGYDGGECRKIAQVPIHFKVADMQIAEDIQLVVGHICMQWLRKEGKPEV